MEQSRRRAPEGEGARRGTRGPRWSARLFGVLGTSAMACGLTLGVGPELSPELSWISRRLGEAGVSSGVVFGCGVLALFLAHVTRLAREAGTQMRSAEEAMHCTQTISVGMRQMVDRITRLHVELGELKEGQRGLLRVAQDQAGAKTSGMQVDATYRLAASMDQLDRRFEDRLQSQQQAIEGRFLDLLATISSTQEQLRHTIEEQAPQGEVLDDLLDAPPAQVDWDLEAEPSLPCDGQVLEELELEVELEQDPTPASDATDVASFDWDSVVLPPAREPEPEWEGLGLLDELDPDDDHQQEPLPDVNSMPPIVPSDISEQGPGLFSEEALKEAWEAFRQRKNE